MAENLPRANVKRVVKAKMLGMAATHFRDEKTSRDLPVHKDALLAFTESAKIFIHYLAATANDLSQEANRQTMIAEDVLGAMKEIEFAELIEPLEEALERYREEHRSKLAEKRGMKKKRKLEQREDGLHEDEDEDGEADADPDAEDDDSRGDQDDSSSVEEDDEE